MKQTGPRKRASESKEPKTQRGRDTREEILGAARKLVSERWVHEVPFNELAAEAHVTRGSLLHLYPHWRNVLYELLHDELCLLDAAYGAASALKRVRPSQRAYAMLVVLIDRAETTGLLYPNLRAEMFTWQGEPSEEADFEALMNAPSREMIGKWTRIPLADQYSFVEDLLGVPRDPALKSNERGHSSIGECLVHLALDLAAGIPSYFTDFDDRRHALRVNIDLMSAGLRKDRRFSTRKRRARSTN